MARLIAVLIVLFPLSFVRVDQRGQAISPVLIQLEKASPAFAAFEDMLNDYTEDTIYETAKQAVHLSSGEIYVPDHQDQHTPVLLTIKPLKIKKQSELVASLPEWKDSESLPSIAERKEILVAKLSKEILRQPSPAERAQELVKKELMNRDDDVRKVATASGGAIIVKKPSSTSYSPYIQSSGSNDNPASNDGHFITGPIRVSGGVGEAGEYSKWRIYRELNGRVAETGSINISEGEFSIRVQDKTGFIVAEVADHFGRVYGKGRVSLQEDLLALKVTPVTSTTIAAYTGDDSVPTTYKPFGNALLETQSEKPIDVSHYSDNSHFFIEAQTRNHFSTVMIGFLDSLKQIPLYKDKAIKAFRSIVKGFYRAIDVQDLALVWGQVLRDGRPVEGAQVEIATGEGRTIYFNEIGIPRGQLQETTSYGQFAIANIPEGVQSVRVLYDGQTFPAQIFPTLAGKISQLNLEVPTQSFHQLLRVFSLTENHIEPSASVRILGLDEHIEIDGSAEIPIPELAAGVTIEVDAGMNFEMFRTHLPRLSTNMEIHLPIIKTEWLNQIMNSAQVNLDRRMGLAFGFAGPSDAEVKLLKNQQGLHRIIFFDKEFNYYPGNVAPAGGGFIAVNLPLGFQTLEVRGLHSMQAHAESFVSEPYFLNLIGSQRFINIRGQENL